MVLQQGNDGRRGSATINPCGAELSHSSPGGECRGNVVDKSSRPMVLRFLLRGGAKGIAHHGGEHAVELHGMQFGEDELLTGDEYGNGGKACISHLFRVPPGGAKQKAPVPDCGQPGPGA